MVQVIPGLYVGSDDDYDKAKERGYSIASMCKSGLHGHRSGLGYDTNAAPQGKNYLTVQKGNHFAANLIDTGDVRFIPEPLIDAAIRFIREQRSAGKSTLVHCNAGHSRGPTTAMLYLRSIGELPYSFARAESIFTTLYPNYAPNKGMREFAKRHWASMENFT